MTDRTKTICPPIFDLGGIKRCNFRAVNENQLNLFNKRLMGHIAHMRNFS